MADRRATDRRFDPRFDPKFQPGYEARNDAALAARGIPSYSRATPAPGVQIAPLVDEADDPVGGPPAPLSLEADDEPDSAASTSRRRNPFVLALWGVSAVLFLAGVVLLQALDDISRSLASTTDPALDYTLLQVAIFSVPALIGCSAATVIGLLFFYARGWAHQRPSR